MSLLHDFAINDFASPIPRRSMLRSAFLLTLGIWSFSGAWSLGFGASLTAVDLRCEYLKAPLGLDELHPRLTWRLESSERAVKQTAYEILVASELGKIDSPDLWDSGKVTNSQTINIVYAGKPLTSRQRCFWKIKIWDKDGQPSEWSEPAKWTMGLLKPEDWKADYISFRDDSPIPKNPGPLTLPPAHQYRKQFSTAKPIRRATIYATALGIYELNLNNQRVGDASFTPGWTDYHKRAYYNTYDVTSFLKSGTNLLHAWVADGWYSGYIGFGLLTGIGTEHIGRFTYGKSPALMAQLEIEYLDGSRDTVTTDKSWEVAEGPIQQADLLMGEFYDARKETNLTWEPAILASENGPAKATFYEFQNTPGGNARVEGREVDLGFHRPLKLEAFPGLPVRRVQEIKPIAITSPSTNVYIFNLGQNFAGVVRLKVKGPVGTMVRLRYGEMLHPDGRLMTENLRKARATDFYILRGDPNGETYNPRFTFHGFQYIELTDFPGKPDLDTITGIVMHSDTPFTSDFECSDPMVNQLFKNIVWTQRANFLDLPTDCPQRDERFGWTGDAQVYIRTATYNADTAAFYTKWLRELMESQRPSGTFPGYAPFPFQHGLDFGTAWCDAGVICPWTIWKVYGDTLILERCWESMTNFIQWRKSESKDSLGVVHGNDWGDWLSVNEKTPLDYIDTAYFAYSTKLMAEMARALGKTNEVGRYYELFWNIRSAFNKKYVLPEAKLAVDTQTAYALALYMDLLPQNLRAAAAELLAKKIRDNDTRMTTGFIGTHVLLPALSSAGQDNLAVQLLQSHKFPSWGYEVDQGATTIWERWNSYTKEKGFGGEQNASMNSFAHYSFGAVCEWMFSRLAGIDLEEDGVGYNHILIHPIRPTPDANSDHPPIEWVRAHYDSIRGRIATSWRRNKDSFELDVSIPPGTFATVHLPAANSDAITESGKELSKSKGIDYISVEPGNVRLVVESGTYHFVCK
jgi:Alpha-L-rhamnosidase N-terminal domain./Bacterial alpha-L-rhamnosidase.